MEKSRKDFGGGGIETGALEVLKRRLKGVIDQNATKVKLIGSYKKLSEEIAGMFRVISSHSGKEDIAQVV